MNNDNDFGLPQNVDVPKTSSYNKKNKKSKGMIAFLVVLAFLLLIACVFWVCYKMMPDFQKWTDKQVEKCSIWLDSDSNNDNVVENDATGDRQDIRNGVEEVIFETTENQSFAQSYYVIVGTFGNFNNAQNKVKSLTDAGNIEAGILEKNGKNYVFINSFVDEPDAEIYLSSLKSTIP
ncbi:MAG: SPOR domain-containing protein, partial [Bacteroidales bacterium]|nr:SPOR domain-containing protein [Bacteroidales bacterium]